VIHVPPRSFSVLSSLSAGAAGPWELVQEGAQVQLVPDPAAGAARGERAAPHHQRRLRLLRYFTSFPPRPLLLSTKGRCLTHFHFTCRRVVAAREGQAGRQDGVDPAQLPDLRQVPHQGQPTAQRCF
jgi:hypothetical protein